MQILLAALIATGLASGERSLCSEEPIRVTRDTNGNVVLHEARLSAPGRLDEGDPVHPDWLMLAEEGGRGELNLVESVMAHGVEVHGEEGGEALLLPLRARPELLVRVELEAGVQVEIVRLDRATGAEVRERLFPSG